MRMERCVHRKCKWKTVRLLVVYQMVFTLLLLSFTPSSFALLMDRKQVATGEFSTAFVFTKTVDEILRGASLAEDKAAQHASETTNVAVGCKDSDSEQARDMAAAGERRAELVEQAAKQAKQAVDDLTTYLNRAEQEVNKAEAQVKKQLIAEAEKRGLPLNDKSLKRTLEQNSDVKEAKRLHDYIYQAVLDGKKSAARTFKYAELTRNVSKECNEMINKRQRQSAKKQPVAKPKNSEEQLEQRDRQNSAAHIDQSDNLGKESSTDGGDTDVTHDQNTDEPSSSINSLGTELSERGDTTAGEDQ